MSEIDAVLEAAAASRARGERVALAGHDLRSVLRSGATYDDLTDALRGIGTGRSDRYSELRTLETVDLAKVEMSFIGGC